jgi:hypothetical protein
VLERLSKLTGYTCAGVMTTINNPNDSMLQLIKFSKEASSKFIVVGDTKTPTTWENIGCDFLSIESQLSLFPQFAAITPTKHYARKNFGYLLAKTSGAEWIYETDDDNYPLKNPFGERNLEVTASTFKSSSRWLNIYAIFGIESENSNQRYLWPRGFDLNSLGNKYDSDLEQTVTSPIQQGLANGDPDVDAIYRLVFGELVNFKERNPVVLQPGQVCPTNSQTTWWHKSVYQLMYLPSTCTFRLTDILRGFVAWRIMIEEKQYVSFHNPVVRQDRNDHVLLKDFKDEVELFLGSSEIIETLLDLQIGGLDRRDALLACYEALVAYGVVSSDEILILNEWNKNF